MHEYRKEEENAAWEGNDAKEDPVLMMHQYLSAQECFQIVHCVILCLVGRCNETNRDTGEARRDWFRIIS